MFYEVHLGIIQAIQGSAGIALLFKKSLKF